MAALALYFSLIVSTIINCNGQQFYITSIKGEPYLMSNENDPSATGNNRYIGYSKDLAETLSQKLGFTYTINEVRDEKYGMQLATGWNGMMGELLNGPADMIIAPFTMTSDRAEVVDYSPPFMEFQLAIMMKKPKVDETTGEIMGKQKDQIGYYVFLRPFSGFLWLVFICSILILVLLLYIVEAFVPLKRDPKVKTNPPPPRPPTRVCANGICGTLRTATGRILQVVFWIFAGIMVAAYIAAFTGDRIVDRIGEGNGNGLSVKSFEDLPHQTQMKYGVIRGGSTYNYIRRSVDPGHTKVFNNIARHDGFVATNSEGIERVRNGSYAFIAEAPTAQYESMRDKNCEIILAPKPFGPQRGFAIATKPNRTDPRYNKLKDGINLEILRMKENGELNMLEQKWFEARRTCKDANTKFLQEDKSDKDEVQEIALGLDDMAGVFYLLIAAIIVGLIIAAAEIVTKKPKQESRNPAMELRVPITRDGV